MIRESTIGFVCQVLFIGVACFSCASTSAQEPDSLEDRLLAVDPALLASEARKRGNPERGAFVFYTSQASCIKCHLSGADATPLGPDLATLGRDISDQHIIDALLHPSRTIRKGFETTSFSKLDGQLISGLIVSENDQQVVIRDVTNLETEVVLPRKEIDERRVNKKSIMPERLVATLRSEREFLDLVSYVMEVAAGGKAVAERLKPSADQLEIKDDAINLDHAGILKRLKQRDFETGERIYGGLCVNCHGPDGNTPSLPTARAFGRHELKFGADPYQMFLTLSRGNGLMAPAMHLSPLERYQVIHFIREKFMKGSNPGYEKITGEYLKTLPVGTDNGKFKSPGERDYGPALASQLDRDITSALTLKLGSTTVAYNLHTMEQAGVWVDGFLNLDDTQHIKARGEGVPLPKGTPIEGLSGWQWGHDGLIDYSHEGLLPRGPLPKKWMDYQGHFLHEKKVVLKYKIDGREIFELPDSQITKRSPVSKKTAVVRRTLSIGPGKRLVLAAIAPPDVDQDTEKVYSYSIAGQNEELGDLTAEIALTGRTESGVIAEFSAAAVLGETNGVSWSIDDQHRLVLDIPEDTESRLMEVICFSGKGNQDFLRIPQLVEASLKRGVANPADLTRGGKQNWPEIITTVGYHGFENGAYRLDTLTIPDSTPWNTWFRTSALDFFPDGQMVLATHGGDVWIVSGIDDDLLELKWKRFAGGLYEPFGIKIVDGLVYVTCKDRLTRLQDLNDDGEADFYESFSADTDVSSWFHAFNFDLQTDSMGNFYYAKCGQSTHYALPGSVIKISADGSKRQVLCTGFRAPNGMGMLPDDRLTVSDNQGNWMPASKISLVKPGGFYGYVQTHARKGFWGPDGGKVDHTKVVPPDDFDQPIIWMPQDYDNSSGGQIWVDDPRWGPLSNRMLHTSFGKGWLYYLMMQDVEDVTQAAIIKLPHNFNTGIMRGRVNPADGQVYVTGLDGWNGNGRHGLRDKGIQRIRYTGQPLRMVTDCQVESDGLRLDFNFPLDVSAARNNDSYNVEQWNYKWQHSYGSDMYHPKTGERGKERIEIGSVEISDDQRTVKLAIPNIHPVNQLHLTLQLKAKDGTPFVEEIYWTINKVPKKVGLRSSSVSQ